MKNWIQILIALLLLCRSGQAQGFINLNFESANLPTIPAGQFGGYVSITNALPGWTASINGSQTTQVLQNNETLGAPSLAILGPYWNTNIFGIIQGNYTLDLTAGVGNNTVSISQTGLVPASALSLLFEAIGGNLGVSIFQVFLGGQELNYFPISTESNFTLYGADISGYAGKMETLTFSDSTVNGGPALENLDAIQFSTTPIPEPSTLGLSILGGLILAGLARRGVKKFSAFGG